MAYSSDSDLYKEFSESDLAKLTGDSTGNTVNSSRISYAVINADAMIDSYLFGRYSVPFSAPIDPIITKLSVDITVSNLYEYANHRTSIPNTIVWRKLNALRLLKDIQAGVVSIVTEDTSSGLDNAIVSNKTADDKYFSEAILSQFFTK